MSDALRLADWLEDQYDPTHNQEDAAAELRRLHTECERLRGALHSIIAARNSAPGCGQYMTLQAIEDIASDALSTKGEG